VLDIESASGVPLGPERFLGAMSGPVSAEATIQKSGTYYVAVRPAVAGATGKASLTLRVAAPPVSLTVGGSAVTMVTRAVGLPATASFRVSSAREVSVVVHATSFKGYTARLYVAGGNGAPLGAMRYLGGTAAYAGPVELPKGGRYTLVLDPGMSHGTGSARVQAHAAPGPIEGKIPPGQKSVSGHSFCGGYSSGGTTIGKLYSGTFCTIDWTVTE
jgi:hypothetical protein